MTLLRHCETSPMGFCQHVCFCVNENTVKSIQMNNIEMSVSAYDRCTLDAYTKKTFLF